MEGLGPAEEYIAMGEGRYSDVVNILLGGGTSGPVVHLGVMGQSRGDNNNGRVNLCRIPNADPGE